MMLAFLIIFVFLFSLPAHAQEEKILRWGADSEGGAPFVFQDPANPTQLIGFEVDLANALAKEMGYKAEFIQNQWDGLVPGLKRGNYDIIINGLEITEDRKQEIDFSTPYYITYEQLSVRQDSRDIATLEDCVGKRVGTLKYSLAERMLKDHGGIDVISYEDDTNPYTDLSLKRLDAVLMDFPIALYRMGAYKDLKFAGGPIGEMLYGIGISKDNEELTKDVNAALEYLFQSGQIREILTRWGLWNKPMAYLTGDEAAQTEKPTAYLDFIRSIGMERTWKDKALQYVGFLPMLAQGALITLQLSIFSMFIAVALGIAIALVKLYGPKPFSRLATAYVEIVRGTPLLIQLYLIYYGLPNIGIKLSPIVAAILGLGLNYAAYEAENYRAGILSIPKSQHDAALALGMSRWQTLNYIVIPQAMRLVIPPVTNDFISLLKDSSLVSVITMVELTKVYGQLAATYFDYLGIGLITAAVYFLIGWPFVRFSKYAERKFS